MRAVVVHTFGPPEVLQVVDVPVPPVGPGQVRIRMTAAAVEPVDVATRAGVLSRAGLVPPRERYGIGWDVAGTVEAVGAGVGRFAVGDAVVGLSDRLDVPLGTHAELVVLDADAVAHTPAGLSAVDAATLPLNGLTAVQALDLLDLPEGRTLLVTGAAGGLGGFTVELAAARGLRVVATAAADDEELVRGLGAEWFVPRTDDLSEAVRAVVPGGVDGALDAAVIGVRARDAVRGGGSFVAVVAGAAPTPLRGIRVSSVWIRADGTALAELAALMAAGRLTPRVADVLPLGEVRAAHARLEAGGLRGRLVLVP